MSPLGEDAANISIVGRWQDEELKSEHEKHEHPGEEPVEGPPTIAEPHERPDDKAQWDEVHGRWIEWDPATETWIPAPDQAPPPAAPPEPQSPS
jgi:hypothetical protein